MLLKDKPFAISVVLSLALTVAFLIILFRLPMLVSNGIYAVPDPSFHWPNSIVLNMLGIIVCQGFAVGRAIQLTRHS